MQFRYFEQTALGEFWILDKFVLKEAFWCGSTGSTQLFIKSNLLIVIAVIILIITSIIIMIIIIVMMMIIIIIIDPTLHQIMAGRADNWYWSPTCYSSAAPRGISFWSWFFFFKTLLWFMFWDEHRSKLVSQCRSKMQYKPQEGRKQTKLLAIIHSQSDPCLL